MERIEIREGNTRNFRCICNVLGLIWNMGTLDTYVIL